MLKTMTKLLRAVSKKANYTVMMRALHPGFNSGGYSFKSYLINGYEANPYVRRGVNLLARGVSSLDWGIYTTEGEEVENPPTGGDLLETPNPLMSWNDFLRMATAQLLLAGKTAWKRAPDGGMPLELWPLDPDAVEMKIHPHADEEAGETLVTYEVRENGISRIYGPESIFYLHYPSPEDWTKACPPLSAAKISIDINNEARAWDANMLRNGAVPGGIFSTELILDEEQLSTAESRIKEKFGGSGVGAPMVAHGGLEYQPTAINPEQAMLIETIRVSAAEIAMVLDVPAQLIADEKLSKYSNYKEARRSLYTEGILPVADMMAAALTSQLMESEGLEFGFSTEGVDALQEERSEVWNRMTASDFLTDDEKRTALGYDDLEQGIGRHVWKQTSKSPADALAEPDEMPAPVDLEEDVDNLGD